MIAPREVRVRIVGDLRVYRRMGDGAEWAMPSNGQGRRTGDAIRERYYLPLTKNGRGTNSR